MCLIGLIDPGLCGGIELHAHRSFVIGIDRHALQTQFPSSAIELRNCSKRHFPSSHSVSMMAAATNPSATPINGLSTANQSEMRQPESLAFGFGFMLFFQAFEDRHFTKREIVGICSRGPAAVGVAVVRSASTERGDYTDLFRCDRLGGALDQRFKARIVAQGIKHRIEFE